MPNFSAYSRQAFKNYVNNILASATISQGLNSSHYAQKVSLICFSSKNVSLNSQVNIWKNPLNHQKLLQKVSQLILVGFSVRFNILKVY